MLVPVPQDADSFRLTDLSYTDRVDRQLHPQVSARDNHDDEVPVDLGVDDCMSQGNVVERAGARSRARDKTSWWRLVWCHERCLKEENEVRRKVLSEAARECGALLICLKKANKFEKWLVQEHRPPFVLLTDCKEVKPCVNIVSSLQAHQSQLAFTIALCDTESDFNRVSLWTQSLPVCNYQVHVWQDIGNPRRFVPQVLACLEKRAQLPTQNMLRQGEANTARFEDIWRIGDNVEQLGQLGAHRPGRSSGKGRGRGKGRGAARCGKEPAANNALSSPALSSSAEPAWDRPVYSYVEQQILLSEAGSGEVNVLSPVCASRSSGQLEQLLKEAMPDHYDE